MLATGGETPGAGDLRHNHPLAARMCLLAAIAYNVTLGCFHGTYSVLLGAVEAKLHVTRELSSAGMACAILGIAIFSPIVGSLAIRHSLRKLMIIGMGLQCIANLWLAVSTSMFANLAVYLLLIGPGQCCTATVLPSVIITRWYRVNRGRAMGLTFMALGIAVMPIVTARFLGTLGLGGTYLLIAGIFALAGALMSLVIDYPPDEAPALPARADAAAPQDVGVSYGQLLRNPRYLIIVLSYAALAMLGTQVAVTIVPMAMSWGIDATRAALLLSVSAVAGMPGAVLFGIAADKMGGTRVLAVLGINAVILWSLILVRPPYPALLVLVGLVGMHAAAMVGSFAMALSQNVPQQGFSRAMGLGTVLSMPFGVIGVQLAARSFTTSGSYAPALMGMVVFVAVTAVTVLMLRRPVPQAVAMAA